jgi:glycosyltransferase involved in cell wall biosynthesis
MPVRNGEAFIRRGIESILDQSMREIRLIISDNASTDATEAICREMALRDPRIRYHRSDHNLGMQANFTRVLDLATAPYFMWACHDDQWDPTYVARMVDVLDSQESVVLAGSNAASIDEDGLTHRRFDNAAVYRGATTAARASRLIRAPVGGGHATLFYGVMRTPVIKTLGLRPLGKANDDDRGYYAYDVLTLLRLVFQGDFHVDDETLYFRRDVLRKDPAGRRRSGVGSLGLERVPRLVRAVWNAHQYYADIRGVLGESGLTPRQELALARSTVRQELLFYPSFARSLIRRRMPKRRLPDG